MWRLRLFYERVGWKPFAIGAAIVVLVAIAAGGAILLFGGGGDKSSAPAATTTPSQDRVNLYYLRAVAPETQVQNCSMRIRFIWKPDYHAIQYLGQGHARRAHQDLGDLGVEGVLDRQRRSGSRGRGHQEPGK